MCGNCTFCTTGESVEFKSDINSTINPAQVKAILAACPERDDPRLLARMAFGITSPRLTAGRWSTSHPLFGSMGSVDFAALVVAFEKECKKAGYTKVETAAPASTSRKRSYTQSSSYSGSPFGGSIYGSSSYTSNYRGGRGRGRGGGYKRGRY